jgi:hypothetical protein
VYKVAVVLFILLKLDENDPVPFHPGPPTVALKVKTVPLPYYRLGLLVMGYNWSQNMYRCSNEMKLKIVHHVGLLYEYNSRCMANQTLKNIYM